MPAQLTVVTNVQKWQYIKRKCHTGGTLHRWCRLYGQTFPAAVKNLLLKIFIRQRARQRFVEIIR